MNNTQITEALLADIVSVPKAVVEKWRLSGKIVAKANGNYYMESLRQFHQIRDMLDTNWDEEAKTTPDRRYTAVELFAGGGGLALGLENAGFDHIALFDNDKHSCATLRDNRPNWNVIEADVREADYSGYTDVDLVTGGFPCQSFSYSGKKLGFEDTRGTLFYEFARAINEIRPKIFLGENVRGLMTHDGGKTLETIKDIISQMGYTLVEPRVLKAIFYQVPQKRERLFLVGIRNDLLQTANFAWPSPYRQVFTLKDALKAGIMYPTDCPSSPGQSYSPAKQAVLMMVPPGGCWKDLPLAVQKSYMKGSFGQGGGKTGMARRLSWSEPSLTLTTSPAQKQTERCHPAETRPLNVREYARIQSFPDEWSFSGPVGARYKQIGNAVPVNLAAAMGRSLVRLLNGI